MKISIENIPVVPAFQPRRLIVEIETELDLKILGEFYNYHQYIAKEIGENSRLLQKEGLKIPEDRKIEVNTVLRTLFKPFYVECEKEGYYC